MAQMRGYVPPNARPGELGVHSLDHFSINVPDLSSAESLCNRIPASTTGWKAGVQADNDVAGGQRLTYSTNRDKIY